MKKILAAVKDMGKISEQIIRTAAALVKVEHAELFVIYVYQVPLSLPLDSEVPEELERGDAILDFAAEIAEELDVSVETHIIQARAAGSGILNEIKDLKIDTAVLGMKHNAIPGDNILGTNVEYVMKHEPCNLVLIHPLNSVTAETVAVEGG